MRILQSTGFIGMLPILQHEKGVMRMTIDEIERLLAVRLSPKRLDHVFAVRRQAMILAEKYGADVAKAELAALLHDITKEVSYDRQLLRLTQSDVIFPPEILQTPPLYHAKTGMLFARDELGVKDEDVLNAVCYHTTGRGGMSILEKVIFVADATSEDRKYQGVKRLRAQSYTDLDGVIIELILDTLRKVYTEQSFLPVDTAACYNETLLRIKAQEK